MIKADIVSRVVEAADVPRVKAVLAVDAILDAMKEALADGRRIKLRGSGVFRVSDRKSGVGRNPKTGVEVAITPGKTVQFKTWEGTSESAAAREDDGLGQGEPDPDDGLADPDSGPGQ